MPDTPLDLAVARERGRNDGPPILSIEDLKVAYGRSQVIHGIDLAVMRGSTTVILGANGSGKSTLLKAVLGLVSIESGQIILDGSRRLNGLRPHKIHDLGIAWGPQGRQTFATLTVQENLLMGAYSETRRATVAERLEKAFELFPILRQRERQLAGLLSGGEQQILSLARALMSEPRLLLLDEPSIGLAPRIVGEVFEFIGRIASSGTTILLVEQNAAQALEIADYVFVLDSGLVSAAGTPSEIAASDAVRRAYLGG